MNCPKCTAGSLRVHTIAACTCGHHSLVCDACRTWFEVKHDGRDVPPYHIRPPTLDEIEADMDLTEQTNAAFAFSPDEQIQAYLHGLPLLPDPAPGPVPSP